MEMKPIAEVARELGLDPQVLDPYGRYMAKVPLEAFPKDGHQGKLVVVTAITPTPYGEGKTTTAIGIVDGMARIGKRAVLTVRQPALGPVFGVKGGGTGGGKSRVMPDYEINLHFTGDFHAVATAHNLLAAMTDNAVFRGTLPGVAPEDITWHRVTNVEDRALRHTVTGLGGKLNGPMREADFDIDAASEVMAVLGLAKDPEDLRARLGRLVVAWTKDGKPVTAADVRAVGPMMALLNHAIQPNLVQTLEGNPAVIHTGPFGNIAHGCSSVIGDQLALAVGDYVITEAGFAADLGFEKFLDIKVRSSGLRPSAAVVVVTVRALKWHGGAQRNELGKADMAALEKGCENLEQILLIVGMSGLPSVVAINRFPDDTEEELAFIKRRAVELGAVAAVESRAFAEGGAGATELAAAIAEAAHRPSRLNFIYPLDASIEKKVDLLATWVYGAAAVEWETDALADARRFEALGWRDVPVCMAKTNLSLSHNPRLRGRPKGFTFPVTGARVSAGAGFVYTLAGAAQTLPALPTTPNAYRIDVNDDGIPVGLMQEG